MSHQPVYQPAVAIIGGGFSGAATAYHLARMAAGGVTITLFEPREILGAGLAYSTPDPTHRINVPASRMTLDPAEKDQFRDWLAATDALAGDPAARLADGRTFPRRELFGRYVAEQLAPLVASRRIDHVRALVTDVSASPGDTGGWRLETADGAAWQADIVVIATSHPLPTPPAVLTALQGDAGLIGDAWAPGALDAVAPDDRVLIVGTGLTMADMVASLMARHHRGPIEVISRRGLRSRGHGAQPVEPLGDFITAPERTALALLRRVRRAVAEAAREGTPWQALFDRLRTQAPQVWAALPPAERRRVIRHLRPYWDTHRFRIAPQTETALVEALLTKRVNLRAASLVKAERTATGIAVDLRNRGGAVERAWFDKIIVTTGPDHGAILRSQPFLGKLAAAGLIGQDPTGLGLPVDQDSHLLGPTGANANLYVAGPLARGFFGELMGLPEVTEHALSIARTIAASLKQGAGMEGEGAVKV